MTRFREEVYESKWYKALVRAQATELSSREAPGEVRRRAIRNLYHRKPRTTTGQRDQARLDAW